MTFPRITTWRKTYGKSAKSCALITVIRMPVGCPQYPGRLGPSSIMLFSISQLLTCAAPANCGFGELSASAAGISFISYEKDVDVTDLTEKVPLNELLGFPLTKAPVIKTPWPTTKSWTEGLVSRVAINPARVNELADFSSRNPPMFCLG